MNEVFFLLVLMFLGGVVSTIVGGGLGIFMIVAVTLFLDIRTSIALTSIIIVTIQIAKMLHFYKFARWNVVGWYIILGIPMSYMGGLLLFAIPERIPELLLVAVAFLFVVMRLAKKIPTLPATRTNLVLFGGMNGLVGGLIGNASMMRLPVLLSLGLSKEVLIGTSALIAFPMNLGKIAAYIPNLEWTTDYTLLLVLGFPTIYISVWLGKRALRVVSKDLFEKFLLCVIFLGALRILLT